MKAAFQTLNFITSSSDV